MSILKHRADAEDAVQTAYLRAFAAIDGFEGRSSLSTWLTRIVINEALGRRRAANRRRAQLDGSSVTVLDDYREKLMRGSTSGTSPETEVARIQVRRLLEEAISALPAGFRLVFVLREIEGMTVEATAEALDLKPATVKTQLFAPAAVSRMHSRPSSSRHLRILRFCRRRLRGADRARGPGMVQGRALTT